MKITKEELKRTLPKRSAKLVNDKVVEVLNNIEEQHGSEFSEVYRENFKTYSKVLANPDYTMTSYLNAVKFVSYRLMDYSIIDSYMLAFPDRYERLLDKYADMGDEEWIRANKISPYASIYAKGDLVVEIMTQSIIPPSILNVDMFQKALNRSAWLMENARSETVQQLAAKTILETLKPDAVQRVELDIGLKENDVINDLRNITMTLAQQQQQAISAGAMGSKEVCEMTIIDVSAEDSE